MLELRRKQRKVNPQCLSCVNHSSFETFVLFVLFLPFLNFMCMCRFFFELDLMLNRIFYFLAFEHIAKQTFEYRRKPECEGKGKGTRPYSVIVQRNRVIWCSYKTNDIQINTWKIFKLFRLFNSDEKCAMSLCVVFFYFNELEK